MIATVTNTKHIVLAKIPMSEDVFKKFFTIITDICTKENQMQIIIRCQILSKCMMKDIKFDSSKPQLMDRMEKGENLH